METLWSSIHISCTKIRYNTTGGPYLLTPFLLDCLFALKLHFKHIPCIAVIFHLLCGSFSQMLSKVPSHNHKNHRHFPMLSWTFLPPQNPFLIWHSHPSSTSHIQKLCVPPHDNTSIFLENSFKTFWDNLCSFVRTFHYFCRYLCIVSCTWMLQKPSLHFLWVILLCLFWFAYI